MARRHPPIPMPSPCLDDLRRHAVARSLFAPTSLGEAIQRLGGFVQADPIRAPARAQDLTLRHRVKGYRAGDLERRYPKLAIEEDFFVNYGFLPRATHALMHPRTPRTVWNAARWRQHIDHLAHGHMQAAAQRAQLCVQSLQRLAHKAVVLRSRVGLRPQTGLDHVQAQHRAAPGGLQQWPMVMHAQVAFEPDDTVAHGVCRAFSCWPAA